MGDAGCQVPDDAGDGSVVRRLLAAVRRQKLVEQGDVEVATNMPGTVTVRDSKHPEGPRLLIPAAEWRAFVRDLRAG
jgi:hypothetical protein